MKQAVQPTQRAQSHSAHEAPAKRAFVKPMLERHERLPEITGFTF